MDMPQFVAKAGRVQWPWPSGRDSGWGWHQELPHRMISRVRNVGGYRVGGSKMYVISEQGGAHKGVGRVEYIL
jgi:hypothetical protein